ncbi:MAG: hypothetical protein ACTSRH_07810 [Promethearchaeota archaeon]
MNKIKVKEIIGITPKRIIHFRNLKGYARIYRDIPLSKIEYLENEWHGTNITLLVIAIVLLLIGFFFLLNIFFWFISILFFIPGIILLVKALKQEGHFLINNDKWKFNFKKREHIRIIEEIIQNIYYLQAS